MSTHDIYRPRYHFTPPANFINDPNGLVFYRGEYHLFYQHNPFGDTWGHMSWGHAVSPDMLRWQHLPVALREEDGVMIFSGSAVVDWRNTSGFGDEVNPPLIAIYTGHSGHRADAAHRLQPRRRPHLDEVRRQPGHRHQLAELPRSEGVLARGDRALDHGHGAGRPAARPIYGSPDLIHWEHLSDFGPAGSTVGEWECPDLFPLSVEGEQNSLRWVLKLDVGPRNLPHGLCGQYFIGHFDGIQFVNDNPPDLTLWADHGMDFYAVQSWSDVPAADGRRLWLAWMNNWRYANTIPTSPWRGAMTIPRSVALRRYPEGLRLVQRPVAELTGCRRDHFGRAGLPVDDANRQLRASGMTGDALEIIADFRLAGATEVGLRVRTGDGEATVVGYDAVAQQLFVDRTHSGDASFSPDFGDRHAAPLASAADRISLHIFVDRCSVELFGGGGRAVITDLIFPSPSSTGLELYAVGGKPVAERLDIWALHP